MFSLCKLLLINKNKTTSRFYKLQDSRLYIGKNVLTKYKCKDYTHTNVGGQESGAGRFSHEGNKRGNKPPTGTKSQASFSGL